MIRHTGWSPAPGRQPGRSCCRVQSCRLVMKCFVYCFFFSLLIMKLNTTASLCLCVRGRGGWRARWVMHHSQRCFSFRTGTGENARRAGGQGGFCRRWTATAGVFSSNCCTHKQKQLSTAAPSDERGTVARRQGLVKSQVKNTWLRNISVKRRCASQTTGTWWKAGQKKTKLNKDDGKQRRSSGNCLFNICAKRTPSRPFQAWLQHNRVQLKVNVAFILCCF